VVWGTALTIDTFCPQRVLMRVDFPAEGLPTTATKAAFSAISYPFLLVVLFCQKAEAPLKLQAF
jgi:hypothetical protein